MSPTERNHDCPIRVLVVENNEGDLFLAEAVLRDSSDFQCETTWCQSSETALALIKLMAFDVILVDHQLGRQSGLDLLAAAQADGLQTPFILLTAEHDREIAQEALGTGATDIVAMTQIGHGTLERAIRYAAERGRVQAKLHQLENFDSLTGLPIRGRFLSELAAIAHRVENNGGQGALLVIDLDRFSQINHGLGHKLGDEILCEFTARLRQSVGNRGFLARLGGDEFALIVENVKNADEAARLAECMIGLLDTPLLVAGLTLHMSCCSGITLFPGDGASSEVLTQNAAMAMKEAKAGTETRFAFYRWEMRAEASKRDALARDLISAIKSDEMFMMYQPVFSAADRSLCGAEALVRWLHPKAGLISPADFIPVAEETGTILPLGEMIVNAVCVQARAWMDQGYTLTASVNISPRQFREADVVALIKDALQTSGLPGDRLIVEITEGVLMDDTERSLMTMNALRALGARIYVDDFGVGYSSLNYLRKFPIDGIKIDRCFIKDLHAESVERHIIDAVIGLSAKLGLKTTAEGVETEDQFDLIRSQGCTMVQGYLLSKPLSVQDFADLAAADRSAPAALRQLQAPRAAKARNAVR